MTVTPATPRTTPLPPWLPVADLLIQAALLLVIGWILLGYFRYALAASPSFDGAMNLKTGLSFLQGHGYGFVYEVFFPFPAQTDGPLILPAALLMWLAGVTPLTTQAVNLAYLTGFTVLLFFVELRLLQRRSLALAGTAAALSMPGLSSFALGGYGEIPVLCWALAALLVLAPALDAGLASPRRLFGGGVLLGLCFLTKVVSLLVVAPAILCFVVLFPIRHRGAGIRLGWLFAGFLLMVAAWELFRLEQLGVAGYAEWWRLQLEDVLQQSGAAEPSGGGGVIFLLGKIRRHWGILSGFLGFSVLWLPVLLVLPWAVGLAVFVGRWRSRDFPALYLLAVLGTAAAGYFCWWLAISPTWFAWLRRIMDGIILQQILVAVAFTALLGAVAQAWRRRLGTAVLVACALAALLAVPEADALRRGSIPRVSPAQLDELRVAERVRDLPEDAVLFGFGWWQAPVLSLFSGRTVMNYYRWDPAAIDALPHKYLVLDAAAKAIVDRQMLDQILQAGTARTVMDTPGGSIFELGKVLPYPPFPDAAKDPAKLTPELDLTRGSSEATRGIQPAAHGRSWAAPDSALLLRRTDENRLSLGIEVPAGLPKTQPLVLTVESPGCLDDKVPLDRGPPVTITLSLTCPPVAAPAALEVTLHLDALLPAVRQLDEDSSRRAFRIHTAKLRRVD